MTAGHLKEKFKRNEQLTLCQTTVHPNTAQVTLTFHTLYSGNTTIIQAFCGKQKSYNENVT